MWPLSMLHYTSPHRPPPPTQTWDLTVQGLRGRGIPLCRNPLTWPAQTCSLGPLLLTGADIW